MAWNLESTIGQIVGDPKALEIVERIVPGISSTPGMEMVRDLPLRTVAGFAPDKLTPEVLAQIEEEFSKL
jgi:hypothetical protein